MTENPESCSHVEIQMDDKGDYFCKNCGEQMECEIEPAKDNVAAIILSIIAISVACFALGFNLGHLI